MEILLGNSRTIFKMMVMLSLVFLLACNDKSEDSFATISASVQGSSTTKATSYRFGKHELPAGMTQVNFIITDSAGIVVEGSLPVSPVTETINLRVAAHRNLIVKVNVFAGSVLSFEGETPVNALRPGQSFAVDIELIPVDGTIVVPPSLPVPINPEQPIPPVTPPVVQRPFITTWKTDNIVDTSPILAKTGKNDVVNVSKTDITQVSIGINPDFVYNYNIDWGDGTTNEGVPGSITHIYEIAGTYTIKITGDFPQADFGSAGLIDNANKLLSIEQWGDIKWQSMSFSFFNCQNLIINADDSPDLSLVTDMSNMFSGANSLNQDMSAWDVSTVTNMREMFNGTALFNQNISVWNVSAVTNMQSMFADTKAFNQSLDQWNTSSVTDMSTMFANAIAFNQAIGNWNVSAVTDMNRMFIGATVFNQNIGNWNVSAVTNMDSMFNGAVAFNGDIGIWNVSSVVGMSAMFFNAGVFNQNIGNWDVSAVTNMGIMFEFAAAFNQDISRWNVSSVQSMFFMFNGATVFNQPIGSWDVSSVTVMAAMFLDAGDFNQDLSLWNVSSVVRMDLMFSRALSFDQNIGAWNVSSVSNMKDMFLGTSLSTINYDALLIGWSSLEVLQPNVIFDAGASQYSPNAVAARDALISAQFLWTVNDGGPEQLAQ